MKMEYGGNMKNGNRIDVNKCYYTPRGILKYINRNKS
jgi:hypothetical protein